MDINVATHNRHYEKMASHKPHNWEIIRLNEVLYYEQPANYIVSATDYKVTYPTPVLTAGKSFIIGYTNEKNGIYTNLPCIIFDDFTTESKYVDFPFKVKSSAMKILTNNSNTNLKYLFFVMQTLDCISDLHKRFWISDYSNKLIFLPPLSEQARIVSRVEALFALIDIIDKSQADIEVLHDELKKHALDFAIQGKLVPQDPTDEPASVLLEKIRAEKRAQLGKKYVDSYIYKGDDNCYYEHIDGKANDEAIEVPFDLPKDWTWARINSIAEVKGGKRIPAGRQLQDENNGHIYIRVTDMQQETLSMEKLKFVPDDIVPLIKKYTISKNDLYLTIAGTIGKVGIVPEYFDNMNLTENAVKISNITIEKEYLLKVMLSSYSQDTFNYNTNKVAQPKLAIERILTCLVPIPPLVEQKRIVDKINEIFAKL